MAWRMYDGRDTAEGYLFGKSSKKLLALRWEDSIIAGNSMTVQTYLSRDEQVYGLNAYACEHDIPANGWGWIARVDAVLHPANELLDRTELCIGQHESYFPEQEFEVDVPAEPGEYTVRFVFMRQEGQNGTLVWPDQTHSSAGGLVSEIHVPVQVVPETGSGHCSGDAGCPDGHVCENGYCVPAEDDDPPIDDPCGGCPTGYVCVGGNCVKYDPDNPLIDPDDPDDGGTGGLGVLAGIGGAAYLYLRERGN